MAPWRQRVIVVVVVVVVGPEDAFGGGDVSVVVGEFRVFDESVETLRDGCRGGHGVTV